MLYRAPVPAAALRSARDSACVLSQVCRALLLEDSVKSFTCAGTVAALYRSLAAAAGLPPEEHPEERLLIMEAAMHRVARRLVRSPAVGFMHLLSSGTASRVAWCAPLQ